MLIQMGRRPETAADDLVGPLRECHERIRAFTKMAVALAEQETSDGETAALVSSVERYFRVAMPLHIADEDVSILPRLRGTPMDAKLRGELVLMEEEHREIDALLTRLLPCWAELAAGRALAPALRESVRDATRELSNHVAVHLEREERAVFPLLQRCLGAEALTIRAEMRARRGEPGAA